jgi:hypothetical protein
MRASQRWRPTIKAFSKNRANDNGIYRLVHHYYDALDNGAPKLQIHDLTWTSDGWPTVADS